MYQFQVRLLNYQNRTIRSIDPRQSYFLTTYLFFFAERYIYHWGYYFNGWLAIAVPMRRAVVNEINFFVKKGHGNENIPTQAARNYYITAMKLKNERG